ncbi:PREDICTED: uncharacterized protein LOC109221230 [Nicotiana attenuata]|uniref:uncharacterized protein LOC109221230 n=1 Tax=Nicotiana attenuata TaxID=49451 RepID=UPI000904A670|nr:PREDICTED: uncharacterized protein LOC109221230 [Nicotiana attenuata]
MSFGIKNAGATYQRLVTKMFKDQLSKTMEVYIDDMLVKSAKKEDHIDHLKEAFEILRKYGMKLNPGKCAFGVASRKFLGFLVSQRGIQVNPDQIKAIDAIPEVLTSKKREQKLTGRIAALSRFISRSSARCHKFFNVLRKDHGLQWNEECIDALKKLKAYLSSPPLLVKANPGECLLVYLAVSEIAVSAVLVSEDKGTQSPIYYISKTLIDAETRYPHLEKLALALVVAACKLRPYFQCHPIKVITTFPLRGVLHKPELSGRLAKWEIELSEHDITYQPQTAIKSQVLADFVADFSAEILPEAEQEALRASACLKLALQYGARRLILHCDSQLVVNQVTGTFQIKEQRLQKYQSEIHKLLREFEECHLDQIPRAQNIEADGLAKLAAAIKNINKENVVTLLHSVIDHVEDGTLPQDKKEAKKLRTQAARYSLIDHNLYKKTFGGPLAKCLGPHQTRQVLEEVHEGHCGAHTGNRPLVRCLIRAGYYRPTMKKEVADYVRRCEHYDNGSQFVGKKTIEFFEKWHIKRILSTQYHPAANGQAESSNKVVLNILKKKLEEAKGLWPELLPGVLWAYRTAPKSSTGETLYSLVYGTEAVIPVEVGEPSLRYSHISGAVNDESRLQDLDMVEERRDMAHIRTIAQKQQVERYYNKKAKVRSLKVGDYVLKAKTLASKDPNEGKLGTNWDGPYKITATANKGAFQLEIMEGKPLQNNWNVAHHKNLHYMNGSRSPLYKQKSPLYERKLIH